MRRNRVSVDLDIVAKAMELWQQQVEASAKKKPPRRAYRKPAKSEFTVRDLPADERPRERMVALGAGALSQAELLACLLGRGIAGESVLTTAQRLLARFGSIHGIAGASIEELAEIHGVGTAKAVQLKAACEMGKRASIPAVSPGASIRTADEAIAAAKRYLLGKRKEHFILLLLDARHRVSKAAEISVGSLDASIVHPRETFLEAIESQAAAIILAHNHPSGDPSPSPEDLELTHRLIECGRILGIPVLDHVIVGAERSLSLKAAGYWPPDQEEEGPDAGV